MVEREVKELSQPDHESAELGFEQKILQGEVIFSGQETLKKVADHKGVDNVGLLETPFNFEARDLGNSILYVVSFPETSLFEGRNFMTVLREAKPGGSFNKNRQDERGVLYDWIMLIEEERKKNPGYQKIYDEHIASNSQIREEFEEFELNHFRPFWGAMHGPYSSDKGFDHEVSRLVWGEREEVVLDFFKTHYQHFIRSDYERSSTPNEPYHSLDDFLRSRGFDIGEEWNLSDIDKIFEDLTVLDRGKLITEFYNELSFVDKERLLLVARRIFTDNIWNAILVNENGFGEFHYDIDNIVARKILDNGLIELRKGNSYVRVEFIFDEQTGFKEPRIVERYTAPEDKGVSPLIVWEKDKATGERSYFCGRIPEGLIRAYPNLFSGRHDSLFGQIVVVAYSQELRDKLPKSLSLTTGGNDQPMREANIPVLVKRAAQEFLNMSPAISGFEDLGDKR